MTANPFDAADLPHDTIAEAALLGSVLHEPGRLPALLATLDPSDFHVARHEALWSSMADTFSAKGTLDIVMLTEALQDAHLLDDVGGVDYLRELAESVPSAAHAEHYAAEIARMARARHLADAAARLALAAIERPADVDDHLDRARSLGEDVHRPPTMQTLADLVRDHPALSPPVVDGLLRRGETMNVIAGPKSNKSWLVLDLLLAVATGREWLGHACTRGRVLLVDNELHPQTLASRAAAVRRARMLEDEALEGVETMTLRGDLVNLDALARRLARYRPGDLSLIVLDAWYRFASSEDENSNAQVAAAYNKLDQIARQTGAAIAIIHHSSKGDQSSKATTDVGAGAGAQSRAADCHLVLRPHEEDDHLVLDAVARSFPPPEPVVLRWDWPCFAPVKGADPTKLKAPGKKKQIGLDDFLDRYVTAKPAERQSIIDAAKRDGIAERRAMDHLRDAKARGLIVNAEACTNRPDRLYRHTPTPPNGKPVKRSSGSKTGSAVEPVHA